MYNSVLALGGVSKNVAPTTPFDIVKPAQLGDYLGFVCCMHACTKSHLLDIITGRFTSDSPGKKTVGAEMIDVRIVGIAVEITGI